MRHAPISLALLIAFATLPTGAQERREPASSATTPTAALQEIADELRAIRDLLAVQVESQTLDLLMRRSELASRELDDLERRVSRAKQRELALGSQLPVLELRLETYEEELEAGTSGADADQLALQEAQMRAQLERVQEELRATRDELALLENRLVAKREELRGWQQEVDRRLTAP